MRTTIDLPSDLHELARQLAHDRKQSVSHVIGELIRLGLAQSPPAIASGPRGMPSVSIGRAVTVEDVRSLDDDG